MLVLQQVAGSVALLLLTGFIVLGFTRSTSVDAGYDPRGLYTMNVDPLRDGYNGARTSELVEKLLERMRQTRGVRTAAAAAGTPAVMGLGLSQPASLYAKGDQPVIRRLQVDRVGAGYLETVGIPVLAGRTFRESDRDEAGGSAIANESLARLFGPGAEALGKTIEIGQRRYQVIGVARDVNTGMVQAKALPGAYLPLTAQDYAKGDADGVTILVRAEPGVDVPAAARDTLNAIDPALAVFNAAPMTEHIQRAVYLIKSTTLIYGGIGLFGLILATVGLAGVTAYSVAQRRKEIGIRMALGARARDVLWLVLREGAGLVVAGTAIGLIGAWGIGVALESYISAFAEAMKTSYAEPALMVGAPLLLAVLAMVACYLPARRSIRVEPTAALREE